MATYRYAKVPAEGERIGYGDGALQVPSNPIIPFIEGGWNGPRHLARIGPRLRCVTYDFARQMPGASEVSTSAFGDQVIRSMPA